MISMPGAPLVSDKKLIREILCSGKSPDVVPGAGSGWCSAVSAFVQHPDTVNGWCLAGTGSALTRSPAAACSHRVVCLWIFLLLRR